MEGQAQILIKVGNGRIYAASGMRLGIYGIEIRMGTDHLEEPIICAEGDNSLIELETVSITDIINPPTNGSTYLSGSNSQLYASHCIFEDIDYQIQGGQVLRVERQYYASYSPLTVIIKECKFKNIKTCGDYNNIKGSAINANLGDEFLLKVIGPTEFTQLQNVDGDGGAIYMEIYRSSQFITEGEVIFDQCKGRNGGSIFVKISADSQIELGDGCQFKQCQAEQGNGGAIYTEMNFYTQLSFVIKDVLFKGCSALTNNSLSYSYSGFGGGIFLGCYGNYDTSSNGLNFHDMKITGNTADKYGQSMYVTFLWVIEWCQYGILGEFVKGNYSDTDSEENDLEGIPVDFYEFRYAQLEVVEGRQKHLEYYWTNRDKDIWHI
ncbi:MAG: hypothetical protein EZS28_048398, partial [Streblomastix strix]